MTETLRTVCSTVDTVRKQSPRQLSFWLTSLSEGSSRVTGIQKTHYTQVVQQSILLAIPLTLGHKILLFFYLFSQLVGLNSRTKIFRTYCPECSEQQTMKAAIERETSALQVGIHVKTVLYHIQVSVFRTLVTFKIWCLTV